MAIKKIKVSNFKSFNELDVELGDFNVLIGANASGKSNFLEIFRFLRDIAKHGLTNAVSLHGGVDHLRNTNIDPVKDLSCQIIWVPQTKLDITQGKPEGVLVVKPDPAIPQEFAIESKVIYEFSIKTNNDDQEFTISKDRVVRKFDFFAIESGQNESKEQKKLGSGKLICANINGQLEYQFDLPKGSLITEADIAPPFYRYVTLPTRTLLLETPVFDYSYMHKTFFQNISVFDFDPKLPKKAIPITGKIDLEEDGSNLAIVLKSILEDKERKRMFLNLIKDLLPFVYDLRVEKFADKFLLYTLREEYAQEHYMPASFLSDGTINLTALIIALYFEQRSLTIIEEPERFVHPFLISKVVNMIEDAAKQKQIIITTHNPETIRYVTLEDILLVSRDKDGFSTISKPSKSEQVKNFLQNEIGIAELFAQDLLGV